MKRFPLLIKPVSADCNMRCEYCFYIGHLDFYPEEKTHRMSDATLEATVKAYMSTEQDEYVFTWQGGEPTLMGAGFFRRAIELQKMYGEKIGATVGNCLQTNGIGITAELAELMSEYHFLAGVSVDGPAEFHDIYRKTLGGESAHAGALRGARLLKERGVEFNTLTLVSMANAAHAREVFRYLADNGFMHQQYIPCMETAGGAPAEFAVSGEEWGGFLCVLFDEWRAGYTRTVSVRLFDSLIRHYADGRNNICTMEGDCRSYFVVEYNGDVYPCDFYVEKNLKLGNVAADSFKAMGESVIYREFGLRKRNWDTGCGVCKWIDICMGDCQKHRPPRTGGAPSRSALCDGWKLFFEHASDSFRELAAEAAELRKGDTLRRLANEGRRPGRNELCPCGSGKKFKKCCGGAIGEN